MIDTDLFDTLVAAAKWEKIAGLVSWSGQRVLFDDYEVRQGRRDSDFLLYSTKNAVEQLLTLYDFVADQAKRKELRTFIRQILVQKVVT